MNRLSRIYNIWLQDRWYKIWTRCWRCRRQAYFLCGEPYRCSRYQWHRGACY